MPENQGLSETIQKSIEGQEPSWKNALSRKVVEQLDGTRREPSFDITALSSAEIRKLTQEQIQQAIKEIKKLWIKRLADGASLSSPTKEEATDEKTETEEESDTESDDESPMNIEKAMNHIFRTFVVVTGKTEKQILAYCKNEVSRANPHRMPFGDKGTYYHLLDASTASEELEKAIVSSIFQSLHNGFLMPKDNSFVPTQSKQIVEYARKNGIQVLELE